MSDNQGGAEWVDDVLVIWVEEKSAIHLACRAESVSKVGPVSEQRAGLGRPTYLGIR